MKATIKPIVVDGPGFVYIDQADNLTTTQASVLQ